MKKTDYSLILCLGMMLFVSGLSAQISRAVNQDSKGDEYRLIWQDNFDGNKLDETNNWNIVVDGYGGGNKELQFYKRGNISVGKEPVTGENCLVIIAKKENYLQKDFTSGKISTQNKLGFKYGKIEARIKAPKTANGLWPAFWMLGSDYSNKAWPKCGEIDILEMGNHKGISKGKQDSFFNGACHWGEDYNNGSYPNFAMSSVNPYSLQDAFHLYTLIWDKDSLKMYLDKDKNPDKEPYFKMPINNENIPNNSAHYFHKQFFIIFNLAVGGIFTGINNPKQITALDQGEAKMYIDYVKVYQKGDSSEEFSSLDTIK